MTGTGTLVRFGLRRDRVKLPAWVGGFALFALYLVTALPAAYRTEEDLAAATGLLADPVGRLLIGPGYGLEDPTLARFLANGYSLYFFLLAALMSILLVTRHTRVEEQTGRAELVRSGVVGRHATLTATLLLATITGLAAGVVVFAVMVAVGGFGAGGSLVLAAGITASALAFAGVTAVTVQLSEYSRAAAGLAGVVLGAAFVLRAGGDMAAVGGSALSWASPLGWGQQTAPFVLDRWWPLALLVAFAAVTAAAGYLLSARRDVGASLFSARPGAARAAPLLGTPWGLALRLQRASAIGWTIALAVTGLVYGAYVGPLADTLADLPEVFADLFGGADEMVAGYLAYMATFMAYLTAVYVVLAVQSLRNEETDGRGEPVLATPVSRWSWLGSNLGVTAAGVVVVMVVSGAATGAGAWLITGEARHVWELIVAHLNQVPGVLVVLGMAGLLFGALPRAIRATWALIGYGFFLGTFGPLLDLPDMAHNLSPFSHAAQMPLEPFAAAPVATLTVIGLAAAALGLLSFRRREVNVT